MKKFTLSQWKEYSRCHEKTYNNRYPGLKTNINPLQRILVNSKTHQVLVAIYQGAHTFREIHEYSWNLWDQKGRPITYPDSNIVSRSEGLTALTRLEATGLIQNTTPGTNIYHSIFIITHEGIEAIKYFNKTQSNLIIE